MGNFKGYIFVALSAVIFGCMPLMTVNLYNEGVNTLSLVMFRSLLALPLVFAMMKAKGIDFSISRRQLIRVGYVCAMGSAVTPVLLFYSYRYISTGMATTLHFVYPALVIIGCAVIFREPAGKTQWLCALLCCAGAMMFCSFDGSVNLFGIALAAASGVVYAAYIIALEKTGAAEIHPLKYIFYGSMSCAASMLAVTAATGSLTIPQTARGWGFCFLFAFLVMVVAVMLFQTGVGLVGPAKASILSTFEPITGTVVGALVFSEPFGLKSAVGTAAILSSVVLLALFDHKRMKTG